MEMSPGPSILPPFIEAGAAANVQPGTARTDVSALGELELDAAVARPRFGRVGGVERLVLAESGGDQAVGRDALVDEELHHRDGALGRQFPVVAETARA